jgi:hypothetical protein
MKKAISANRKLGERGSEAAEDATKPGKVAAPPSVADIGGGARDGMGAGRGGLSVHPSAKSAAMDKYEPKHTSKTR